jgi:hypothetical protein
MSNQEHLLPCSTHKYSSHVTELENVAEGVEDAPTAKSYIA